MVFEKLSIRPFILTPNKLITYWTLKQYSNLCVVRLYIVKTYCLSQFVLVLAISYVLKQAQTTETVVNSKCDCTNKLTIGLVVLANIVKLKFYTKTLLLVWLLLLSPINGWQLAKMKKSIPDMSLP